MDPLPSYGVTTSINGNCGFSMAPASKEIHPDVADIFDYFEDIPKEPATKLIPWDWVKWSEYRASMERNVKLPLNFAAFCGHVPLRLTVMGQEAWERAATPAEIDEMVALLDDALAAGAIGFSTNLVDSDRNGRLLPPLLADDAEFLALFKVVARHPGATIQVPFDTLLRKNAAEMMQRIAPLVKASGARAQWGGSATLAFQDPIRPELQALQDKYKAEGVDFATMFMNYMPDGSLNFVQSQTFYLSGNFVWQEMVNAQTWEEKLAMLRDPQWLERAREAWDNQYFNSLHHDTTALTFRDSESGAGPLGITLADYMRQTGINHPSDALATWVRNNGAESVLGKRAYARNEEVILNLLKDPQALGNLSDSGAHGKMFCGAGFNVQLLIEFVREKGLLTIEEGVHNMTGKVADFFGLHDRGVIEVGRAADIAVFDLDEIEFRPEVKTWDVPDGKGGRTYRYTRPPAPMRLTLVNGVPTFDNGAFTGRFPGEIVRPGPSFAEAAAAE
jgi:N-acyl-D-aspartate/D-glutamate deacylase